MEREKRERKEICKKEKIKCNNMIKQFENV